MPRVDPKKVEAKAVVARRSFLQERSFAPFEGSHFRDTCQQLGLGALLDWRQRANLTLVRRYYAHRVWQEDYPATIWTLEFNITALVIHTHLQLPKPNQPCSYQAYLRNPSSIPDDVLVSALCLRGASAWDAPSKKRKYLKRTSLTADARMWLHLITCNIIPTSHKRKVPTRIAALMFLLSQGRYVNIAIHIYAALKASIEGTSRKAILFPHLLTEIFQAAGIREREEEFKDVYVDDGPPMEYERLGAEIPDEDMEDVPDIAAQVAELSASQARLEAMQARTLSELELIRLDQGRILRRQGRMGTYFREFGRLWCAHSQLVPPVLPPDSDDDDAA